MSWKRKLAWTAIILLIVIVAVVGTGLVLLHTRGFREWVLVKVEQKATESLGGRVEIQNFQFHPSSLRVEAYGITVHGTEPASVPPLLQIEQLALGLKIVSLLHHKIDLREITVRHPVVDLMTMRDGTTNLPHPATSSQGSTNVFDLGIEHVLVREGEVYFADRKTPLNAELHDLELEVRSQAASNRYAGFLSYRDGRVEYGTYRPLPHELSLKFTADPSQMRFNPVVLRVASSSLEINGSVHNFSAPAAEASYHLTIHPEDFRALLQNPSIPIGEVSLAGSIDYQQRPNAPVLRTVRWDGRLSSRELRLDSPSIKTAIRNLEGEFRLAEGNFRARLVRADLLGGRLQAEATMLHLDTKPVSRVRAALAAISLDAVRGAERTGQLAQIPISGHIQGTLEAGWIGTMENVKARSDINLDGRLASSAAGTYPVPLAGALHATYNRASDVATVANSFLATPHTRVDLNGTAGQRLDLTVRAHAADLRELDSLAAALESSSARTSSARATPASLNLAGAADAKFFIQGTRNDPHIQGQLRGRNLEVENTEWRILQMGIKASKSAVSVENGSIVNAHQGYLSFNLGAGLSNWHYLPHSSLRVQLSSRGLPVAQLLKAAKKDYPISGNLAADVYLHGSQLSPVGQGSLKLVQARAYGQPIQNLAMEFTGNGSAINSTLSLHTTAGSAHVTVTAYPNSKGYELHATVPGVNLAKLQLVQERNLELTGVLSASASGRGTLDNPQLTARVAIPQLQVRQTRITGIQGQLNVAHHNAQFALDSEFAQSGIQARANVDLANGYFTRATLDTKPIPLEALLALYQPVKSNGVHGLVEVHGSLSGPLESKERLQAQVVIPTLRADYQGLTLGNRGPLRVAYRNAMLVVEPSEIAGTDTSVRIQGQLPLQGSAPVTLAASGTINLELLRLLVPDVNSSGQIIIQAHVGGARAHPMVEGQAQIKGVSLNAPTAPLGLENLNGVIDIGNNQLNIRELKGEAGGGQLSLTGVVGYSPQLQMNVSLEAKSVRVLYQDSLRIVLDSNLNLVGTTDASTVEGRVLVDNLGFIHKNFDITTLATQFQTGSQGPPPSEGLTTHMKLNLAVQSSDQLNLASNAVSLEGQLDLRVIGTAADPVIVGRTNFTAGDVYLMNRRYEIKRALIQFANPNRTEPVVNMLMTTTINQYDLNLNFIGPVDKMRTNFTSNPPLPTADIINLIARGQTQEEAQATPSNFGAQSVLSQAAASQISTGVQKLAGLSSFSIDPTLGGNDPNPGARVAVQKRVTNKLLFTFASDVTSAQREIIQGQYQFNKRWSATVTRDENGGVSVDGKYRTTF